MRLVPLSLCAVALSACVQLTPAGGRVQVLASEQMSLVEGCRLLATVTVSSRDALRNAAAAQGGDTAVMNVRDVGTTQYIMGDLYDCSATGDAAVSLGQLPLRPEPTPEEKANSEYLRKSALCQSKGGVWIGNQCVIAIE